MAEVGPRVSIWSPDGSLVRNVGRPGEGPGEFGSGISVQLHDRGFHVADNRRFTSFSSDGTLIETFPFPSHPAAVTRLATGHSSRIARYSRFRGSRPLRCGASRAAPPSKRYPSYGCRRGTTSGSWTRSPRWTRATAPSSSPRRGPPPGGVCSRRRCFGDYDLTWFDPVTGSVVVVRRTLGRRPGRVARDRRRWGYSMDPAPVSTFRLADTGSGRSLCRRPGQPIERTGTDSICQHAGRG